MFSMTINDFLLTMATVIMICGVAILGVGVFTMIGKIMGKEMRTIADQTAKLAQKGLSEDVAGLVGNARTLIQVLNEMIKTTAGIGMILIVLGIGFIAAAYFLVMQIG